MRHFSASLALKACYLYNSCGRPGHPHSRHQLVRNRRNSGNLRSEVRSRHWTSRTRIQPKNETGNHYVITGFGSISRAAEESPSTSLGETGLLPATLEALHRKDEGSRNRKISAIKNYAEISSYCQKTNHGDVSGVFLHEVGVNMANADKSLSQSSHKVGFARCSISSSLWECGGFVCMHGAPLQGAGRIGETILSETVASAATSCASISGANDSMPSRRASRCRSGSASTRPSMKCLRRGICASRIK